MERENFRAQFGMGKKIRVEASTLERERCNRDVAETRFFF